MTSSVEDFAKLLADHLRDGAKPDFETRMSDMEVQLSQLLAADEQQTKLIESHGGRLKSLETLVTQRDARSEMIMTIWRSFPQFAILGGTAAWLVTQFVGP